MSFTTKISEQSPVPAWFFAARKERQPDDQIIARIRSDIASGAQDANYDKKNWDDAFIDMLARTIFKMYSSWM